jgi:Na+:H+ antiporter, NhaA family
VAPILGQPEQQHVVAQLARASRESLTPLQRMEHAMAPWSVYVVLPLFALANAGITFTGGWSAYLADPISLGVVLGLVLGKPVGIVAMTWLAVWLGFGRLGEGLTWRHVIGLGCLGGIGFTMSLFIATLAFTDPAHVDIARFGIFAGSLISAAVGVAILRRPDRRRRALGNDDTESILPIAT